MANTRHRRTDDPDLDLLRRELLDELETLGTKAAHVHQALDDAAAAFNAVRAHVNTGGSFSDLARHVDPKALRSTLSTSLDELERTRHQMQRLLFKVIHAEGMTMSDIARAWGISRQLVSRLLNEPVPVSETRRPID